MTAGSIYYWPVLSIAAALFVHNKHVNNEAHLISMT
jgi:hypothetical protein